MAITGKLTALKVAQARRSGLYGDGGGLSRQPNQVLLHAWIALSPCSSQ